jgi:transposase
MIALGAATRIYLAAGPTDMRRGFDGLADLARHVLEVDPLSGHLCIFCNRRKNRVKIIYVDATGTWVCSKHLQKGRYSWPESDPSFRKVSLSSEELVLLLGGIELERARKKDWWRREVA